MHPRTRAAALCAAGMTCFALACGGGSDSAPAPASTPAPEAASPRNTSEVATGARAPLDPAIATATAAITGDFLREQITTVSADRFQGRGPGTPADRDVRGYLAQQLKVLGYTPGGFDESFEQPFALVGVNAAMPAQWVFKGAADKQLALQWNEQYIAGSGTQRPSGKLEDAEVVFVGYGIQAPEYQWDDFKGQDLKGKVLLMLNNDPDWDPALFAGKTRLYYGRWTYKYESAARQGAAGAIIIHTTPSAGYPFQVVQTSWSGEQFELPDEGEPRIEVQGWVTESAARELVQLGGQELDALIEAAKKPDFAPVALGVTTSLAFENTVKRTSTANVAGLLRGSDPELRDEVVVYTAHHDHLGVGKPDDTGDTIYNGAKDNAAGVAQVLAIAKAFRSLPAPPRRSVLILFVGAEEQGLLGSKYYAEHPTFVPGKIAANINYDGGNIWGRARDTTFIGKGKSTLDPIVESFAARQDRIVKPDQLPDRGFFYRSDQFNFAKIGVPTVYLDEPSDYIGKPEGWGKQQIEDYEAHRYHQPSDEIDASWTFDGMVEDAQLGFWTGLAVANANELPSWVPGDEFEQARKQALQQANP